MEDESNESDKSESEDSDDQNSDFEKVSCFWWLPPICDWFLELLVQVTDVQNLMHTI